MPVPSPQLSVLIVNWNGREMLRGLLASIESTRGPLIVQTIVVDNASADGSPDMVAADFPDVVLIRNQTNQGFARGNNQAARTALAPLLLLLNNDTVVRPGALAALVGLLNDHPDYVAAGPQLVGADVRPQRSGRNLPTIPALLHSIQFLKWTGLFSAAHDRYRNQGFDPQTPGPIGQLAAAALIVRRDAFDKIGGFDEEFPFGVEDVDLCRRLGQLGIIYYLPDARIEHLGRISSRANRGFVYRGYEIGWARYLKKHHGPAAARLYKTLVTIDMPVRLLVLALQCLAQTAAGRSEKAGRTSSLLAAAANFTFTGLPAFWSS